MTQLFEALDQRWDMEQIFPGGSGSPELESFLIQVRADLAALHERAKAASAPQTIEEAQNWSDLIRTIQDVGRRFRQASAFVNCLVAADTGDEKARLLGGQIMETSAAQSAVWVLLQSQILQIPESVWQALLAEPEWVPIAHPLEEMRSRAKDRLPPAQETLVSALSVDGYHAWGRFYNTIVGRMSIPFEREGKTARLSVGQVSNLLSNGDPAVREDAFKRWNEAWAKEADLIAEVLNHLSGYRLSLYRHRGWNSVLREPLDMNRMKAETLEVMWDVIEQNKGHYVAYLERKARMMGKEALGWQDVMAPLTADAPEVPYEEAAAFIVDQFRRFSPEMADLTVRAFRERWIEVENRPGKRPGGFCSNLPISGQSRIFMTYAGSATNVSTLAHELGHAWHQHVMNDLPWLAQGYAMNVAETASTLAELVVADAAIKNARSDQERIALLADKAESGLAYFMNIHARFLFESRFYEERKKGMLSVERLNQMMVEAQQRAYKNALGSYEPYFWASKLHFYATPQPFYNFPYTFGFLFSAGIYARALAEGPAFERKYVELLRDTGRMKVEDLAMRHLGVDLTRPEFWQSAIEVSLADVREFLRLTE